VLDEHSISQIINAITTLNMMTILLWLILLITGMCTLQYKWHRNRGDRLLDDGDTVTNAHDAKYFSPSTRLQTLIVTCTSDLLNALLLVPMLCWLRANNIKVESAPAIRFGTFNRMACCLSAPGTHSVHLWVLFFLLLGESSGQGTHSHKIDSFFII
jgi:hypothetical protein